MVRGREGNATPNGLPIPAVAQAARVEMHPMARGKKHRDHCGECEQRNEPCFGHDRTFCSNAYRARPLFAGSDTPRRFERWPIHAAHKEGVWCRAGGRAADGKPGVTSRPRLKSHIAAELSPQWSRSQPNLLTPNRHHHRPLRRLYRANKPCRCFARPEGAAPPDCTRRELNQRTPPTTRCSEDDGFFARRHHARVLQPHESGDRCVFDRIGGGME